MRFIPKEKLGKKAKRALESAQRVTWGFNPATRKAKNPKAYSRKKPPQEGDDPFGGGLSLNK